MGEWFFEENTFYSSRPMVLQMIEAISRDGNFNINISLTPEGTLEPGGEKMWRDFGAFLKTNGQAIYGSRAWKIIGEGRMAKNRKGEMEMITFPAAGILPKHDKFQMTTEDIRFTEGKDGALYAFIMAPPQPGERLKIRSFGKSAGLLDRPVKEVSLLGSPEKIRWNMEDEALAIDCPASMPSPFALVFRIAF